MSNNYKEIPIKRVATDVHRIEPILSQYNTEGELTICGGYVRWAVSEDAVPIDYSDIDIFCSDMSIFGKVTTQLEDILGKYKVTPFTHSFGNVQLIRPPREDTVLPLRIHQHVCNLLDWFDMSIAKGALKSHDVAIVHTDLIDDDRNKEIHLHRVTCPVSTFRRVVKYMNKGYKMSVTEMVRLFASWEDMDQAYKNNAYSLLLDNQDVDTSEVYKMFFED